MKKNIWIWLAAFLFAILLWLQNVLLSEQEEIVSVPIRIENKPAELIPYKGTISSIGVTVKTKGINLLLFCNRRSEYVIDGDQLEYGSNILSLSLKNLSCSQRMKDAVSGFENEVELIEMDRIVIESLPVIINYQTREDEKYFQSHPLDVTSSFTRVKGASKIVSELEGIPTEKISKRDIRDFQLRVRLVKPDASVELLEDEMIINLSGDSDVIKTIPLVPIIIPENSDFTVSPQKITVKISGTPSVLAKTGRDDIFITLENVEDETIGKLLFRLPEGVEVQEYTPEKVRIIR